MNEEYNNVENLTPDEMAEDWEHMQKLTSTKKNKMTTQEILKIIKILTDNINKTSLISYDIRSQILGYLYEIVIILSEQKKEFLSSVNNTEKILWNAGKKILAIKSYRDRTGCSVKTSKEIIFDAFQKEKK